MVRGVLLRASAKLLLRPKQNQSQQPAQFQSQSQIQQQQQLVQNELTLETPSTTNQVQTVDGDVSSVQTTINDHEGITDDKSSSETTSSGMIIPQLPTPISGPTSNKIRGETIALLVGPSQTPFTIHKDLLVKHSAYIEARLKPCWNTSSSPTTQLELLDISVGPFRIIIHWLYSQTLPPTILDWTNTSDAPSPNLSTLDSSPRQVPIWLKMPEIYYTADLLMMTGLQNAIVDLDLADHRAHNNVWKLGSIEDFHACEITHTPYYQLFLDSAVQSLCRAPMGDDAFEKRLDMLERYPGAVRDVLDRMNRWHRERRLVWLAQACRYHIHADAGACKSGAGAGAGAGAPT